MALTYQEMLAKSLAAQQKALASGQLNPSTQAALQKSVTTMQGALAGTVPVTVKDITTGKTTTYNASPVVSTPAPQYVPVQYYQQPQIPQMPKIDYKSLFQQAIDAQKPAMEQARQDMLRNLAIRGEQRGLTSSGIQQELERKSEQGLQNYFAQQALQQALQMAGLNLQREQMLLPYSELTAAQRAALPLEYFNTMMPWMTTTPAQQQNYIINLLNSLGVVPGSSAYNELYREIENLLLRR